MDLSLSPTIICYFVITLNEIIVKNIFELFISFCANFSNVFCHYQKRQYCSMDLTNFTIIWIRKWDVHVCLYMQSVCVDWVCRLGCEGTRL